MKKLKGVCEIELHDHEGNVIQKTRDENMITNAVANIFKMKGLDLAASGVVNTTFINWLYSNYKNLFSGVLLFNDKLDEDANIIYPKAGVTNVGHAGGSYTGANNYRGTINESESGAIENGYKFVWDFATNQANGTIKSVCLTSIWGGNGGYDNDSTDNTTDCEMLKSVGKGSFIRQITNRYRESIIKVTNDYYLTAYTPAASSTEIQIWKYSMFNSPSLNGDNGPVGTLLKTVKSLSTIQNTAWSNTSSYSTLVATDLMFIDREQEFISIAYILSTTTVHYFKMNFDGDVLMDKVVTLSKEITVEKVVGTGELNGSVLFKTLGHKLYKLNVTTGDIEEVQHAYSDMLGFAVGCIKVNNRLIFTNGYNTNHYGKTPSADKPGTLAYDGAAHLMCTYTGGQHSNGSTDVNSYRLLSPANNEPFAKQGITNGHYFAGMYDNKLYSNQLLMTPYLATIDNLDTPVTKTASMTMKVIYTIVESND